MKDYERVALPHAVYRMYDGDKVLLYVGCSYQPLARLDQHKGNTPWITETTVVTFEWYPDYILGRRAEMAAIVNEKPKYNSFVSDPDRVGYARLERENAVPRKTHRPRGNGVNCPICGKEKEHRAHSYCRACASVVNRENRIKAGWTPKPRKPPTTICPRCKGIMEPRGSYCKQCKSQINKAYREKQQRPRS